MADLREFLSALASHWVLLSMALVALLLCQFGRFDADKKVVPALILFALGCILYTFYLTVTAPLG
jgi:hypothetical protein